jgi:hypothetical protein
MLTYLLIFCSILVLPENFAVYVDCWVQGLPSPSHPWVLMGHTHNVQEVRGHMETWEGPGSGFCDRGESHCQIC